MGILTYFAISGNTSNFGCLATFSESWFSATFATVDYFHYNLNQWATIVSLLSLKKFCVFYAKAKKLKIGQIKPNPPLCLLLILYQEKETASEHQLAGILMDFWPPLSFSREESLCKHESSVMLLTAKRLRDSHANVALSNLIYLSTILARCLNPKWFRHTFYRLQNCIQTWKKCRCR